MAYEVHLEVFDGPFDLLLQLITAQQVDVYEVRLVDIVDAFCAEMKRLESTDLELATEFLLIAATLIELKCRRLLPGPDDVELDEELALFEARYYLLARLVECKTFTGAAGALHALEQAAARSVARRAGPDERFEGLAPELVIGVSPTRFAEVARRAFAERVTARVDTTHVHRDEVSVQATIESLCATLRERGRASFKELSEHAPSTAHVVACFLALLELYKQSLVELDQGATFGELAVTWTGGESRVEDALAGVDEYDVEPVS